MSISRELIAAGSGRTYLVAANRVAAPNGGIGVVDITEPSSMVHIGDFAGANVDDPGQLAFDPNRRFAAVAGSGYISVFDLKDPLAAYEADDYNVVNVRSLEFSPDGNYLFTGVSGSDQIYTFSVASNGTITIVGNPAISTTVSESAVLAYDAQRDFLFGGSASNYFTVVSMDAATPASLSLTDHLSNSAFQVVVRVRHDDAAQILGVAGNGTDAFSTVDTSDTSNLVFLDSLDLNFYGSDVIDVDLDTANQVAYVTVSSAVVAVDYSTPSNLTVLGSIDFGPGNNYGISYRGGYVFVTNFTNAGSTVYSVDVSDPTSMSLVGTLSGLSGFYVQNAIVQT